MKNKKGGAGGEGESVRLGGGRASCRPGSQHESKEEGDHPDYQHRHEDVVGGGKILREVVMSGVGRPRSSAHECEADSPEDRRIWGLPKQIRNQPDQEADEAQEHRCQHCQEKEDLHIHLV